MIRGYLANDIPVKHAELPGHEGASTGVSALDTEGDIEVGVWEHSVGTSTDTEVEEVFVVLAGRGTVTCDQGGQISEIIVCTNKAGGAAGFRFKCCPNKLCPHHICP
jgi:hypothetical protein